MKSLLQIPLFILLLLAGCNRQVTQFYPDSYFESDALYINNAIRFSLNFNAPWRIIVDPDKMNRDLKRLAKDYQKQGLELLFVGTSPDAQQGTQGIASYLNMSVLEYANFYRDLNINDVTADSGIVEMLVGNAPMAVWVHDKRGFRFADYFFTFDSFNIRISFWAPPPIFDRFKNEYLSILTSMNWVNRF